MKSSNRLLKTSIIIVSTLVFSWLILQFVKLQDIKLLQEDFLFTYLGVFLGFALTIYTFGISILETIKTAIDKTDTSILNDEKKTIFFKTILSGFNELKSNILFITVSFLFVVVLAIVKNIDYPEKYVCFLTKLKSLHFLETIYLSIFILSIVIIFDLLYSMFNLAEISLFFFKNKIK